jgi:hypothetical protein
LSRTLSRISSRLAVPETVGTLCIISQEITEEIACGQEESARPTSPHPNEPIPNCQLLLPRFAGHENSGRGESQRVFIRCRQSFHGLAAKVESSCISLVTSMGGSPIYPINFPGDPVPGSVLPVSARKPLLSP